MKVDIAVQTLSASTADSIEFLKNKGFKEFTDAESTIESIRIFNDLFDVFNTKSNKHNENPLKTALCLQNKSLVFSLFKRATQYIKELKIIGKNGKTTYLCSSQSKTGFIGYIINMQSLIHLFNEYVTDLNLISSINTYSFSQDHLELLYGICRSLNGYNDNPNVQQFCAAFRKVLVHNTVFTSKDANCNRVRMVSKPLSNILTISSRRTIINQLQDDEVPNLIELEQLHQMLAEIEALEKSSLTENLKNSSTTHIASVIEHKIRTCDGFYCQECANVFDQNRKVENAFINRKYQEKPCIDTFKICQETDRFLKLRLLTGEINFNTIYLAIFQNIDIDSLYAGTDFSHDEEHKLYLVRTITDAFIQIKATYIAKTTTLDCHTSFIRSKFHKLIHFRGQ